MVKRLAWMATLSVFLALPVDAADWTATWDDASIARGQSAYIALPSSTDAGSTVLLTILYGRGTICYDTNHSTDPGTSEGVGTVEIILPTVSGTPAADDATDGALIATLDDTEPCAHNLPSGVTYILNIGTTTNTTGGLRAVAY